MVYFNKKHNKAIQLIAKSGVSLRYTLLLTSSYGKRYA